VIYALGIDPGLGASHYALVGVDIEHRPALLGCGAWATPEDGPLSTFPPLSQLPHVILVESARGSVIPDRDADPILRDAMMSGRIQEYLRAHFPTVALSSAPAFGTVQGWNWRSEIGCNGMTDAGIRLHLERLLGEKLPRGPRGGQASHIPDAVGVALAAALRVLSRPLPSIAADDILTALTTLSPLESAVLAGAKSRKTARRQGRALAKRFA
jgi:hypothetical protein